MGGADPDSVPDIIPPWDEERSEAYFVAGDVNGDGLGDFVHYEGFPSDSDSIVIRHRIVLGGGDCDSTLDWFFGGTYRRGRTVMYSPPLFGDFDGNGEKDIIEYKSWGVYNYPEFPYDQSMDLVLNFLTDDSDTFDLFGGLPHNSASVYPWNYKFVSDISGDGCDEILICWHDSRSNDPTDSPYQLLMGSENPDVRFDFDFDSLQYTVVDANNIGDVNGDGWDDLGVTNGAIGAYWGYVLLGGPEFDDFPEAIIVSPFERVWYNGGLGKRLKWCGDFDNNGIDDILVLSERDDRQVKAVLVVSLDRRFADAPKSDAPERLPASLSFDSISPNPFNSRLTVDFSLPPNVAATLRLSDVAGRTIRSEVVGESAEGSERFTFDGLEAGIYFISLETPQGRVVRKAVCVK